MDIKEKLKQRFNVPKNWDKHDYEIHRYSFDDLIEASEVVKESDSLPCVISSLPEYDVEEINEIVQQLKDGKISLFEAIGNTWNKGYFVGAGDKFISSC